MTGLTVTFFGDFASPESYLTELSLARVADERGLTVAFRAAAEGVPDDLEGRLAALAPLAEELGAALRLPLLLPSTGKAHEPALFARERGRERELRGAIHRALWEEGRDVGRIDVLQELADGVDLDPFDVRVALDIDRFRDEVLRDREVARRLGIARPPVLYLGTGPGATILVGAQTPSALARALARK